MRPLTPTRLAALLAGLLLAALPRPASAVPMPPDSDRWIQVQTAHFVLYSEVSEKRTVDLGRRLERFRAVLSRFNKKFRVDPAVTTGIYVFKDDASLTPYKSRFNGRAVELAGLFMARPDGYYIEINGAKQGDPLEVIYHEYVHHYLGNNLHNIPVWFNEGLAECYGAFRADDKNASIGLTQTDHVLYLRQHDLLPLHDLFAIAHDSPDYNEGERRGVFYAESWLLMHYLMWDKPERKPQFTAFLERLDRGEDPDSAFPPAFGIPYETLENELRLHVRQTRFMSTIYKISDLGLDETATVAPMKREDVLFRLGDLLSHLDEGRAAEAEELLREAQRIAPDHAAPYAGMAYLAQIAGRLDDAVGLYDKAIAIDPNDPVTNFHLGQCLVRRAPEASSPRASGTLPADLARAEDLFGMAIRKRPDFGEAYVEYGRIILEQGGADKAAIPLFEAARVLLPSRIDVVVNLAILYARTGQAARARDVVENVLTRMNDPQALELARSRIKAAADWHAAQTPAAARDVTGVTERKPEEADETSAPALQGAPTNIYNEQVAYYNQAVALANKRDYKGAIALLEKLRDQVQDKDLHAQVLAFLAQLKKDAARR